MVFQVTPTIRGTWEACWVIMNEYVGGLSYPKNVERILLED
jgi:hypothetical protein